MKLVLPFIVFVIFLSSCQNQEDFSWLEGDWVRINEQINRETFEQWEEVNGLYKGVGLTISEGDTVFNENMALEKIDDNWALVVSSVNDAPTVFKFTEQGANFFTCENPANEFPKAIKYFMAGDTLKAEISNDQMSIDFAFLKE
ncbi:DUF6265 family protein [Arcticibacterium luteifluviistationis]|uniref:Lipocalin-like domain-containing protein n=1 Tax=Arcticibacterium luteifluviistationis TaxID=1784714 RepID=A0A2Z4GC44_9BACT|nr:DUF6265 family protein [Arcticibacterium luteifluviistationis]AWV98704.1 hypothetical protein DJ013_11180 [Arcticibacterium luteifluviistationis]